MGGFLVRHGSLIASGLDIFIMVFIMAVYAYQNTFGIVTTPLFLHAFSHATQSSQWWHS